MGLSTLLGAVVVRALARARGTDAQAAHTFRVLLQNRCRSVQFGMCCASQVNQAF